MTRDDMNEDEDFDGEVEEREVGFSDISEEEVFKRKRKVVDMNSRRKLELAMEKRRLRQELSFFGDESEFMYLEDMI